MNLPSNENWDYVGVSKFHEALSYLEKYIEMHGNIANLVIVSHASKNEIALGGSISVDVLNSIHSGEGYVDSNSKNNVKALSWIAENTKGWICFLGCKAGTSGLPEAIRNHLNATTNGEYNLFFNTHSTVRNSSPWDNSKRAIPWNTPLSVTGERKLIIAPNPQWLLVRRSGITPINVDLSLSNSGTPINFVNK